MHAMEQRCKFFVKRAAWAVAARALIWPGQTSLAGWKSSPPSHNPRAAKRQHRSSETEQRNSVAERRWCRPERRCCWYTGECLGGELLRTPVTHWHQRNEVGAVGCCQQRPAQMSSLFVALTTEENWRLCRYLRYQRGGGHLSQMLEKSGDKLAGVAGDAEAGVFWTKSKDGRC